MALRSRILRLVGLTLAGVAVVVTAVAAIGYGVIQARWAKDQVADAIAAALQPEGGAIEIGKLDGALPYRLRLQSVSVSDEDGVWLEIEEAELDWNPLSWLFRDHVDANKLLIKRPHLLRQPVASKTEEDSASLFPSLPAVAISIKSLVIDDLEFDPEVAGTEAHFDASGRLTLSQAGQLLLYLELQRSTRQDPTVMADIVYSRETDTLSIDLKARELMGGPWAYLLGWADAPPWQLRLQGSGPLNNWSGRLEASAADLVQVALDLRTEGPEPRKIKLFGSVALDREFEGTTLEFLASPYELDVVLALLEAGQLKISEADISNAAGQVEISGSIDLIQETLDTAIVYRPSDSQKVTNLIEPFTVRSLALNGRVSGQLAAPIVSLAVSTTGLRIDAIQSETAEAKIIAKGDGDAFSLSVEAALNGISLVRPSEDALSLPSVQLAAQGLMDLKRGLIDIDQADITSSIATTSVSGQVPIRRSNHASLQLALDGELRDVPFEAPVLDALLHDPLKFHALLGVTEKRDRYVLTELTLDHPLVRVTGRAELPAGLSEASGRFDILVERLNLLARRFDLPINGGALSISGELDPGAPAPQYSTRLTADNIQVKGVQLGPLDVGLVLSGAEQELAGRINAKLAGLPGPTLLTADITLAGENRLLDVQSLELVGAGARLTGQLHLASFDAPLEGELSGIVRHLTPWTALFDVPLEGSAELSASFAGLQSRQQIKAQTVFRDLRLKTAEDTGYGVDSATLSIWNSPETEGGYSFDLHGEGASLGPARVEQFSMMGGTDFAVSDFTLEAAGHYRGDLSVSAAGRLDATSQDLTLEIGKLSGQILESTFDLSETARVVQRPDKISLDGLTLVIGEGDISASGHYGRGSFGASLELRRVPLRPLAIFLPQTAFTGKLSGKIKIDASRSAHLGALSLNLEELAVVGYPEPAPLVGTISGNWAESRIQISVDLSDQGQAHLRASGEGPLAYEAEDGTFSVPSTGALKGDLSWRGEIGPVWDAFGSESHQLRGTADVQAQLSGTVSEPHASGKAHVTGGSYLNLDFGTRLSDVEILFQGSEREIILSKATATDGGAGTVSGHGRIRLDPALKFPAEIELTAKDATLARSKAVKVKGGGTLRYTRQRGAALLKGALEASEIEAILVDVSSTDIADLDVVEVGGAEVAIPTEPIEGEGLAAKTDLDVTATIPRRAFIRGRGLDSEWHGQTRLTGTSDEPILTGTFELVRGRFDFAGRGFRLTRGTVEFRGGTEIDPWMDLESEYRSQGFKAIAQIAGPVSSPKITLSSDPALPQDEVMARILFGTSVSELGPVEALQLADAVRTLSSPGKGGVLGKARSTLGLDVFRVGGNGNGVGGTTVTGGKYLTDNIYIEVERGLTGEEDKISVEVQVTPRISVESELMQDADSNIGIKWRKDY